ncbi:hypothetical protein LZ554_001858 [Drepanopeziza brunnea f. sp. 'monogermtubi']|nr:hypothetical protein LZ554_001858 [Drepanopeziza brunnea f. sp. 'monogermtubi']
MSFPNFITCFAIALLLVVATATATAIASPDSLPYLVSELLITGTMDDIPFNLTGTIQQVEVQLASQYPQYHNSRVHGPPTAIVTRQLSPLVDNKVSHLLEFLPDWKKAATTAIQDGVNSLNNIGAAGCRVNALTCARVSCSYDSAIHLCNDNVGWPINRDCRVIANFADDLKNQCNEFNAGKKQYLGYRRPAIQYEWLECDCS